MNERKMEGYASSTITGGLDRKLVAVAERKPAASIPENGVLCHCDGTADRLQACLANAQRDIIPTNNAALNKFQNALSEAKQTCSLDGLTRLGVMAGYVEKE
jgi:hypothetical protein